MHCCIERSNDLDVVFAGCENKRKNTFFNKNTDDTVRVEDKVGALGVLVADDGRQSLELLRLGQKDHLGRGLVCLTNHNMAQKKMGKSKGEVLLRRGKWLLLLLLLFVVFGSLIQWYVVVGGS